MISLAFLLVGLLLGYYYRTLRDFIREVESRQVKEKPEVGVTPGLYQRANENNVNQGGETGLVSPKTPQQLEWEEQERLREQQLHVPRG